MTVKLTAYKDVLKKSKEALDELKAPIKAKQMKKQAEIQILDLDEKLIAQDEKIISLTTTYPIKFDQLADALDERELLQRRQEQFKEIVEQLFPEN